MGRFRDLDAVTIDAYGTLVELDDPVGRLREALHRHGVERTPEQVGEAFRAEVEYYVPRAREGTAGEPLRALRRECARVFLAGAGADVVPESFVDDFMGSLRFVPLPGTGEALAGLRARGLVLAVVSNWDADLPRQLEAAGLDGFAAVVSSADAGVEKPDAGLWQLALERLGVDPARALHVGDRDLDELGAHAAGLRFEAAPLAEAVTRWS